MQPDDNNPPRRTQPAVTDTWNGEPLADAKSANEDIHYRIHDAGSGALLGFGTGRGGALGAVVAHCRRVEDAHPGRHLVIRAYDGPAGMAFDRPAGP